MKNLWILLLVPFLVGAAPTRVNNFVSQTTIRAAEVNTDFNNLYNYLSIGVDTIRADGLDAITEINSSIRSGSDQNLITGSAGADTLMAIWNGDGDIIGLSGITGNTTGMKAPGMIISNLISCDTIDTDSAGLMSCGVDGGGGGGSGAFSDDSDPIVQNTTTKDVHVGDGADVLAGKLEIGGDANQPQLVIEGFSTQTDDILIIQNDANSEVFAVSNAGVITCVNCINSDLYIDGSIDTAHYASASVDATAMGANSVDSSELVDGSVDNSHMSDNSIDSAEYVDNSIDTAHYAPASVDEDALGANSVNSSELIDGSVDLSHMSSQSVDSDNIVEATIVEGDLDADVVPVDEDFMQFDSTGSNFTWRSDVETISDLSSAATGWNSTGVVIDFALTADADAGDFDLDSLDRLEFFDAGLFIDGGTDAVMLISTDGTLEIATNDWDISTTGVQTNMGNITSNGTVDASDFVGNLYDASGAVDLDIGSGDVLDITLSENGGTYIFDDGLSMGEDNITNVGIVSLDSITGDANAIVIGDNGDTVQIDSSDWDISTVGDMTNIGAITMDGTLAVNGDLITSDGVLVINATSATSFNEENITNVGQLDVDTIIGDGATLVLGDNTETIAINSSDWDIGTTGIQTGMGNITSNGLITSVTGVVTDTWEAQATGVVVINTSLTVSSGDSSISLNNLIAADPCGTGTAVLDTGAIYMSTAGEICYCDNTGTSVDLDIKDDTACAY